MAYDEDLDSTHTPSSGGVAPTAWGTAINANFADIGAWTAYTPTWTATTTNPAIGNGTISGAYQLRGKYLIFRVELTIGSTTTMGSGTWQFQVPASQSITTLGTNGFGMILDSSPSARYPTIGLASTGTKVYVVTTHDRASVTDSAPITWASGDQCFFTIIAELA